jgi:hypothetical protein
MESHGVGLSDDELAAVSGADGDGISDRCWADMQAADKWGINRWQNRDPESIGPLTNDDHRSEAGMAAALWTFQNDPFCWGF